MPESVLPLVDFFFSCRSFVESKLSASSDNGLVNCSAVGHDLKGGEADATAAGEFELESNVNGCLL